MIFFKLIHLLAALIWVGGMFFAYVIMRPAGIEILQPSQRLRLWDAALRRFFMWVWVIVATLLVSGLYMIYLKGGMAHVGQHIYIMLVLGLLMMLIYCFVFFAGYVPLSLHVANQRWQDAARMLGRIRKLIAVNLVLGMIIMCVAVIGSV